MGFHLLVPCHGFFLELTRIPTILIYVYLQQEHINLLKKYFIDVLCIKFSFIRFRYFVCGCGIYAKLKMQNTILSNDIQYIKTSIGLPLLNHKD